MRIEFDGKAGTLSYGVNGQDPEVGFTDVTGTIAPSCGSYRSGVKIRLLKVEVYETNTSPEEASDLCREPSVLHFELDPSSMQLRSRDTLSVVKDKKDKREMFESSGGPHKTVTARADRAVSSGVHEWVFEVKELSRSPLAFGVCTRNIPANEMLGGTGSMAWRSDGSLW